MTEFYLTTWNAQGAVFTDDAKLQVLRNIISKYDDAPHFFAIQEAGANPTLHQRLASISYQQSWSAPTQARNERCTLGFLVPKTFRCQFSRIQCSNVRNILCCDLEMPAIRIGCIHAKAESHIAVTEVQNAQRALNNFNRPFILAGDMNSAPMVSNIPGIKLFCSKSATQQSGGELDYFFASSSIEADPPFVHKVGPSDHNPVILKVYICMN